MCVIEAAYLLGRTLHDVFGTPTDSWYAVGMLTVYQRPQNMAEIAVRTVETHLLELFHHHLALHFERTVGEKQLLHAVGLGTQCGGEIHRRYAFVEIREIIGGPGVV